MSNEISIVDYKGPGYKTIWTFQNWRIAVNNDAPKSRAEGITTLSRHLKTDEAFTLLQGKAILYFAHGERKPENINSIDLNLFETVVVHAGTWHVIETFDNTKILIVENADTGIENSEKYPFSCSSTEI